MIHCFSDRLSARPGDTIKLHIASTGSSCELEISRLGKGRVLALHKSIVGLSEHPIEPEADRYGCNWPVAAEFTIGKDWRSGYYDIQLTSDLGEVAHHFVCVKPARGRKAGAALVLATNTYQAYNSWGGRNAYCNVAEVMAGRMTLAEGTRQGLHILSSRRPFSAGITYPPEAPARLMNTGVREFEQLPTMRHRDFFKAHDMSAFDAAAGYVHKWEHMFVSWAEKNGVELDYLTDYDLETDPEALQGYNAAIVVGHSEYWSRAQREQVDAYVDNGGNFVVLSGNTCYWKIRWDDGGDTFVCHKVEGFDAEPNAGLDATHLWSHPAFGRPEAELTGLTFFYGGYHQFGMCVARGSAAYTVYDDYHWALEGTDLLYGDQFGGDVPLLGFENDGCLLTFDETGRLVSVPRLGVPADLEVIAIAPAAFAEDSARGYPRIVNPEDLNVAAAIAFGEATDETRKRLRRGHAVMAAMRRGKGQVFNGGTTEWAHGLEANNRYVSTITMNVLKRFGAVPG